MQAAPRGSSLMSKPIWFDSINFCWCFEGWGLIDLMKCWPSCLADGTLNLPCLVQEVNLCVPGESKAIAYPQKSSGCCPDLCNPLTWSTARYFSKWWYHPQQPMLKNIYPLWGAKDNLTTFNPKQRRGLPICPSLAFSPAEVATWGSQLLWPSVPFLMSYNEDCSLDEGNTHHSTTRNTVPFLPHRF